MKSAIKVVSLDKVRSPLLAIAVGELSRPRLPSSLRALDRSAKGELGRLLASGDFTGKRDQTSLVYPTKGPERVLLIGLGRIREITRGAIRRSAAIAGRTAVSLGANAMAFHLAHETTHGGVPPESVAQVMVEGAAQGAWTFTDLKATAEKKELQSFDIVATRKELRDMERGRKIGTAIALGHYLARNLQALPGNVCTPEYLANVARRLGSTYGYKVTIWNRTQMQRQGMGAMLAVAQGSRQEPQFIVMEYKGAGRQAPICFVGKGVTFDSGGISIKPALHMEDMKYDMSGAAAVFGLFETLAHLKPAVNVVGIVPATENMPSGTAIKPGDIVTGHYGKSIEIVNTDAEGRLILADALSYVRKFKPACVIDAATLTGAVVIGLGHHASGLMSNDDQLLVEVGHAGDLAGERCWPLPLWDEYREQIKSDFADVKNTGGRQAGTITAAWFLREFVDGYRWAHLDIAGTAWTESDRPDIAKGPTGTGVRLFTEFVLGRAGG